MEYGELMRIMEEVHARRLSGFNCAEGVFWGVTRSIGLDVPVSCMTGFGGGDWPQWVSVRRALWCNRGCGSVHRENRTGG
jgi:hypothetical protein